MSFANKIICNIYLISVRDKQVDLREQIKLKLFDNKQLSQLFIYSI